MEQDCPDKKLHLENNELFHNMVENARDGINITQNGDFKYVNKAFCDMVGYTKDELCRMKGSDLLAESDKERMMTQHFRRMEGVGEYGIDYTTLVHRNGTELDIEFNVTPIVYQGSNASFISIRDITERKKMQEKLEQSEQKYRNLVENARDGIIITQFGKFKFVNKAFCNIVEFTEEELIESSFLNIVVDEDKERLAEYHRMRMAGEKHHMIYEAKGITKSGKVIDFEINTSFIEYNGYPATFIILRDHTEHKALEETLRTSENKYRKLFEAESDAIFLIEKETGRILDANPAASQIYGYSHQEFLTLRNVDISAEPEKTKESTANDHHFVPVRYHKKKNGSAFAVEISAGVTELEGRQVHIITARDITERIRMQNELSESESKYRTLIEKSLDGIVISQDAKVILVNNAFAEMLGYSVEECMEKFGPHSIVPEDQERVWEIHNRRMSGELSDLRYSASIFNKNGDPIIVEFNSTTIEIGGKPASFITARDITRQIRMQKALEKSERKFRELADLLPQTVFEFDPQGFVTYFNKAGRQAYGFDENELSFNAIEGISPDDRERMRDIIQQAIREKRSDITAEYTAQRKDGSSFPVIFYGTPMFENDQYIGSRGLVIDISERKAMEEALKNSERKFRELADLLPQTIFELDLHGNVSYLNKAGRIAFGHSENDIGFPATSGIVPEDHERLSDNIKKAFVEKGRDGGMEYTALRQDGTTFPIVIYSSPMAENNELIGIRGLIIDISERKAMEEALRQSEKKYRELTEMLPQAVYELDVQGKPTFMNKAGLKAFGLDKGQHVDKAFDIFIPEDRQRMTKALEDEAARVVAQNCSSYSEPSEPIEYTAKRVDGTTFPVIIYGTSIVENCKVIGSRGIIVDISERKAMEEALRKSERKFRELADLLPQTVFEFSPQGIVTYFNKAARQAYGFDENEISFNATEGIAPEDRERLRSLLQQAIQEKRSHITTEYTARRTDGSTFPVIFYGSPMFENDQYIGSRGLIIDISERKAMEEALRKSEEHYRQVIQSLQEGLFVLQDEKFRFVNDAIVNILGYTVEEMTGKHFSTVIPPELRDESIRKNIRRKKGHDDSWSYEFKLLHKDGQTRIPVILSTNLTELDGKTAVVGTAKDITDRIKAEEEIKAAHKRLAEINQDLEQTIRERTKELTKANTQLLKLQKENLQSQFDVLKQQVNPHFLFNSLNVLTSLIRLEPELAEKFTEHLAKVYRYVLENKDNELVNLSTEISFLDAYIFLINIRFMDKVVVNIRIPEDKKNFRIIPLAMQLLIENAIKHNAMSKKSPLVIDIFIDESGDLNVVNNLQEREAHMTSTGVGLKNIQNRYRLLNNTVPVFEKTETHFLARIPLVGE